jgi:hypothetical protein
MIFKAALTAGAFSKPSASKGVKGMADAKAARDV